MFKPPTPRTREGELSNPRLKQMSPSLILGEGFGVGEKLRVLVLTMRRRAATLHENCGRLHSQFNRH